VTLLCQPIKTVKSLAWADLRASKTNAHTFSSQIKTCIKELSFNTQTTRLDEGLKLCSELTQTEKNSFQVFYYSQALQLADLKINHVR